MIRTALLAFAATMSFAWATPAAAQGCVPLTVYFNWNSSTLSEDSQKALEELAVTIAWKGPDLDYVLLSSHTDSSGSRRANEALARRRAEVVRDTLLAYQVPGEMIAIRAIGTARPRVVTAANVREPRNRRVELLIQMSAEAQARQLAQGNPLC